MVWGENVWSSHPARREAAARKLPRRTALGEGGAGGASWPPSPPSHSLLPLPPPPPPPPTPPLLPLHPFHPLPLLPLHPPFLAPPPFHPLLPQYWRLPDCESVPKQPQQQRCWQLQGGGCCCCVGGCGHCWLKCERGGGGCGRGDPAATSEVQRCCWKCAQRRCRPPAHKCMGWAGEGEKGLSVTRVEGLELGQSIQWAACVDG